MIVDWDILGVLWDTGAWLCTLRIRLSLTRDMMEVRRALEVICQAPAEELVLYVDEIRQLQQQVQTVFQLWQWRAVQERQPSDQASTTNVYELSTLSTSSRLARVQEPAVNKDRSERVKSYLDYLEKNLEGTSGFFSKGPQHIVHSGNLWLKSNPLFVCHILRPKKESNNDHVRYLLGSSYLLVHYEKWKSQYGKGIRAQSFTTFCRAVGISSADAQYATRAVQTARQLRGVRRVPGGESLAPFLAWGPHRWRCLRGAEIQQLVDGWRSREQFEGVRDSFLGLYTQLEEKYEALVKPQVRLPVANETAQEPKQVEEDDDCDDEGGDCGGDDEGGGEGEEGGEYGRTYTTSSGDNLPEDRHPSKRRKIENVLQHSYPNEGSIRASVIGPAGQTPSTKLADTSGSRELLSQVVEDPQYKYAGEGAGQPSQVFSTAFTNEDMNIDTDFLSDGGSGRNETSNKDQTTNLGTLEGLERPSTTGKPPSQDSLISPNGKSVKEHFLSL